MPVSLLLLSIALLFMKIVNNVDDDDNSDLNSSATNDGTYNNNETNALPYTTTDCVLIVPKQYNQA
jgi:hypothetical protein